MELIFSVPRSSVYRESTVFEVFLRSLVIKHFSFLKWGCGNYQRLALWNWKKVTFCLPSKRRTLRALRRKCGLPVSLSRLRYCVGYGKLAQRKPAPSQVQTIKKASPECRPEVDKCIAWCSYDSKLLRKIAGGHEMASLQDRSVGTPSLVLIEK